MVDRVVDDVLERLFVLALRFDEPGPEPLAEDMVATAVAVIERACVLPVEIAHAVGQVR
jgi:hypothetical protein